jgi:elongation factor 2 kinase
VKYFYCIRPNSPLCAIEKYLDGNYRKHNNNYGYVNENERNTPQAFSHFTWEASGKKLIVVDIQGVDDYYTDPQIHIIDEVQPGEANFFSEYSTASPGNLGTQGVEKFFETHQCNEICKQLGLAPVKFPLLPPPNPTPIQEEY